MKNIFSVWKPVGISSYDVIRKLKSQYPGQKIGHGGTLDPLAEGILVIGVGEGTKQLQSVLKNSQKVYEATIELGKVSETDDAEGPISESAEEGDQPIKQAIISVLKEFTGVIDQVPPRYAAVKISGVPAYKRARRSEQFQLEAKKVTINEIIVNDYEYPILKITVTCGSGVYIRALARDIGAKLGTGAYLSHLKRTRVGDFH